METAGATDLVYLRALVFDHSHNVLEPSRDYLFETRLTKLLRNQGMTRLDELVRHLRARRDPVLSRAIAEAMTINETSFFRDCRPFDLLRTELLPKLIEERRMTRRLRFWSAACSTGQEAYSLAMLILEHFPQLATWNIRIEAPISAPKWSSVPRQDRFIASKSTADFPSATWSATSTAMARTGL